MSNIYVSIDPSWSYNFFGGLEDVLDSIDPLTFTDNVYRYLADFIRLMHNFRISNQAEEFNKSLYSIWLDIESMGDLPVPYFQVNFRQLFNQHLSVFSVVCAPVTKVIPITSQNGDLTGLVLVTI